jgi:hypothetical protein
MVKPRILLEPELISSEFFIGAGAGAFWLPLIWQSRSFELRPEQDLNVFWSQSSLGIYFLLFSPIYNKLILLTFTPEGSVMVVIVTLLLDSPLCEMPNRFSIIFISD